MSGQFAFALYVAQKNQNDEEMKHWLFAREDLRDAFFDKYEINTEIAIEIERVDHEAWQRAQMAWTKRTPAALSGEPPVGLKKRSVL